MPFIRSLAFKYTACYSKLVAVILSLNKIMPSYSYYVEKGLVYITIITPLNCQPSFYTKCIKLNIYFSCNVHSVFNIKYTFLARFYNF